MFLFNIIWDMFVYNKNKRLIENNRRSLYFEIGIIYSLLNRFLKFDYIFS